jgi:hypothetical protein
MTIKDRRQQRHIISGRRTMSDRRLEINDDYNGQERRTSGDRRNILDRRR